MNHPSKVAKPLPLKVMQSFDTENCPPGDATGARIVYRDSTFPAGISRIRLLSSREEPTALGRGYFENPVKK
jgi:hypothetical protein